MTSCCEKSKKSRNSVVQAIHTAVKGRARYKVKELYNSEALKKYIEFRLLDEAGIAQVRANPLTGNVLVIFNPACSHSAIASLLEGIVLDYRKLALNHPTKVQGSKNLSPSISKFNKLNNIVKEQDSSPWHLIEADNVVTDLQTSRGSGLSSESVREKLQQYGLNILPEAVPRSKLSIFIDQFKSLPVALLGVAAGLSVATGGLADALVIMGVVVANAAIGYATESQSEKIINSLKSLVKPSALAIRDGTLAEISAQEIVLGDILVLKPGSYVAADARLIEANRLSVDESALTGESMPVTKTTDPLANEDVPLADRVNMLYMGTLVTGGQGLAVVVATGRFTEMGRIQSLVCEAILPETPMQRQLDRAGNQLVLVSGAVCGVVFAIGLWRGYGFLQMLKSSISLAVAAVPEGLPTIATTTLALGIRDMRKHNVLIRRLDAVETLGSVQTICLDKTGTITQNKMSVVEVCADTRCLKVSDGKFMAKEEYISPYTCDELLKLIHVSVLCNESEVSRREDGEYIVNGSSTENALMYMAISSGVDAIALKKTYPLVRTFHRSETQNFMSTIHATDNHRSLVAVKGSPEEVLDMCQWHIKDGETVPLKEADRLAIEIENENMAGKALRVLGAAYTYIDDTAEDANVVKDLIWLGLVGMADPVRKGVKELMGVFHQAGIDTVMITGDQSPTAYAIGNELNLSKGEPLSILDSTHLTNLEPEVMKGLCERVDVFARISPAHKLQIVQALQSSGKVVSMTGDGINDAPALKAANVGVAMGHAGTDAAREVADVVLEDDDLETMIVAVSRGRTIYNNIRKSVHYLLSTNLSEIMVMLIATAGGIGQPLNAMQLLWLNLVTDVFPGLALALEPPEPDVLNQPPRNPDEPIIKTSDFKRITLESGTLSVSILAAYGYGIMRYGMGPQASTIAFMSMTMSQLLHAISCRSKQHSIFSAEKLPPNQSLKLALGGSFALQILPVAVPGLRNLLKVTPINILDGVVIGNSALLPFFVNEQTKKLTQGKNV